jgi:16S rRNA C967 or C1407 C5-methylase (RsmB/RsmF family)/NOL1/NOP2/fmu family ribosome biogenesis protein
MKKSPKPPLPDAFCSRIRMQFPEDSDAFLSALDREPVTSVQMHPFRNSGCFSDAPPVPWNPSGRILNSRPSFTFDPLFHAGCFYPQESSSMFIHWLVTRLFQDNPPRQMLDLCAAPGGKSILLLSAFPDSTLVANEIHPSRNAVLRENLTRWGIPSYIVTRNEKDDFIRSGMQFDCVLVDAPCSGEGMFRKDPAARTEWSGGNVAMCATRQRGILSEIGDLLRPGGILLYSTCTFSRDENESRCEQLMMTGEFTCPDPDVPPDFPVRIIRGAGYTGYAFYPHLAPGEGFFVAAFRKKDGDFPSARSARTSRQWWQQERSAESVLAETFARYPDRHPVRDGHDTVILSPFTAEELNRLADSLFITSAGTELGRWSREKFNPSHGLAMCGALADTPSVELDLSQALSYLSGETLRLDSGAPEGWVIVRHSGVPLGWARHVSGRFNNNYPKESRIRSRQS